MNAIRSRLISSWSLITVKHETNRIRKKNCCHREVEVKMKEQEPRKLKFIKMYHDDNKCDLNGNTREIYK